MLRKIIFSVFIGLMINCSENRDPEPRPFARVSTFPAEEINSEGATLSGEITMATKPVIDHGFILSKYVQFSPTSSVIISLGPISAAGKFQTKVEAELEEGVKYYVKAFAKTAEFTSFGSVQEFISLGSKAPQVNSISPTSGVWKDAIVLRGKNFSKVKSNVTVKFDSKIATVISSSTDSIVCQVPQDLNVSPATVQVSVFGNSANADDAFSILSPEIHSVSPAEATIGTTVTVTGKNFNAHTLQATLGGVAVTPKQISTTSIIFDVPLGIQGPTKIKIVTALGNGSAEADFTAIIPVVTNVSPLSGTYNDLITITVENWFEDQQVSLLFGPYLLSPIQQTPNTFTFQIPESTETYQYDLRVKFGEMEIPTGKTFTINPPQILSVSPLIVMSDYLTISGKGFSSYHLDVQVDDHSAGIVSNDHETIQIYVPMVESHLASVSVTSSGRTVQAAEKVKIPFARLSWMSPNAFYYSAFSIGDELYLVGEYIGSYYLYRFDRLRANWDVEAALPFAASWEDYSFTIGQILYYYSSATSTFWAYNIATGFTQMRDVPFDVRQPSTYVVKDLGYVVGGYDADFNQVDKVWQYDPVEDEWNERSAFGESIMEVQGFVMNDICYTFLDGGQLAAYDPQSDQWTLTSHVFDLYSLQYIGFHKGKVYLRQIWGSELIEYSLETSSYKYYEDGGFLQNVVSDKPFSTSTYLYYLNSSGHLWEFDSDFLN